MQVIMPYSARDYNLAMSAAKVLLARTGLPGAKFRLYRSSHAPEPHQEILDHCAGVINCKNDSAEYPLGPNEMFAGLARKMVTEKWNEPVFLCEADGFPTCHDWYERVKAAHHETGALVTGSWVGWVHPPHYNGNLVIHPDAVRISPWLGRVTMEAWDCFHAEVLAKFGAPNKEILNPRRRMAYYPTSWWLGQRQADGHKPAWIHGCQNFQMWEHIAREGFEKEEESNG